MNSRGIRIDHRIQLEHPVFLAGFGGWGDALDVSMAMVQHVIDQTDAKQVAEIEPDFFYRMDEKRPEVVIEKGRIKNLAYPGGAFYAAKTGPLESDLLVLKAQEPSLAWGAFINHVLDFAVEAGVRTVVTLGSMYDNVLHTDRVVSGIFSSDALMDRLKTRRVIPITYKGPSAIHSQFMVEGIRRDLDCVSLWCHCPYYMQGTRHFGLMAHLVGLINFICGLRLEASDLESKWEALNRQIKILIDGNEQLKTLIEDLKKEKRRGNRSHIPKRLLKKEKIIDLRDFMK